MSASPNLSERQLFLLGSAEATWRTSLTGPQLAKRAGLTEASIEGIHITLASLVRHSYLSKRRIHGIVHYQVTRAGTERLRAERSLAKAAVR